MSIQHILVFITLKSNRLYIESPDWLKNEIVTIDPLKEVKEYFKYTLLAASHCKEIFNHLERTSNLKLLTDRYASKRINFVLENKIDKNLKKLLHFISFFLLTLS